MEEEYGTDKIGENLDPIEWCRELQAKCDGQICPLQEIQSSSGSHLLFLLGVAGERTVDLVDGELIWGSTDRNPSYSMTVSES